MRPLILGIIMQLLICIDPGETSGILIYRSDSKGSLALASLPLDNCIHYLNKFHPQVVLVENKPKYHEWSDELVASFAAMKEVLHDDPNYKPQVIYITPGLWKPIAKAQKWKVPKADTQHEKDVYNIFRYFFFSHFRFDIGEDPCLEKTQEIIKTSLSWAEA